MSKKSHIDYVVDNLFRCQTVYIRKFEVRENLYGVLPISILGGETKVEKIILAILNVIVEIWNEFRKKEDKTSDN